MISKMIPIKEVVSDTRGNKGDQIFMLSRWMQRLVTRCLTKQYTEDNAR